jgi:hypothetical protein
VGRKVSLDSLGCVEPRESTGEHVVNLTHHQTTNRELIVVDSAFVCCCKHGSCAALNIDIGWWLVGPGAKIAWLGVRQSCSLCDVIKSNVCISAGLRAPSLAKNAVGPLGAWRQDILCVKFGLSGEAPPDQTNPVFYGRKIDDYSR